MAKLVRITGMSQVLSNMKTATKDIGLDIGRRLKTAGLFVQRESQKIVPVDLGNLHNTARTDNIGGKGFKADVVVHYGTGADYAVYVHENLDARHKPGKRAKYLEAIFREKKDEIFKIVAS